ncbi:MAG: cation:proton antiporter domain-containing protein [Candidatus Limnocylindrales bacterium]
MHDLPLITTIAAAFTAAWLLGLLTQRLGLSPIVGYLLAGVLIGPHSPGFVGDVDLAHQLAEVGVILLMFGVGLHFHLKDLLAVKSVAIPGAIGQSLVATLLGIAVFAALGLPVKSGAVIGMAMAVASTVVLMRVLMDADALNTPQGHVAVGWLLVEDVFTVIILVLIPVLGTDASAAEGATRPGLWASLGLALLKLSALVAIVMLGGSRAIPWVLVQVARLRSRELFTLTVLVFSIAIAAASYAFFGASMALGAFLAGMVVAQSPVSHQAAADALPMRDAFAVLFFVSVGMLFDPAFVVREPLMILAALAIILIAKPLAALLIVALLGHSARTALTVALGLAQIGEFSFILSELARKHGLMPESGHNVLVAAAIISITLNPILFRSLNPIEARLRRRPRLWTLLNGRAERRAHETNADAAEQVGRRVAAGDRLAVVVGYGPVGRSVHRLLRDAGLATIVIELNMDTVSDLKRQGQAAIFGDASREAILEQAGVRRASHLVVALPHSADRASVVVAARDLNSGLRILVRAHYLREREELEQAGATAAVFEEGEAAVSLARLVLADTGADREAVERKVRDLRLQLILENVSNLRSRRVRSVMVPWTRVHRLSRSANREEVAKQVARQRFSRWPVVEPETGRPVGYLLAKDLIAEGSADADWTPLVRPLRAVRPEDDIESTLMQLQQEGATVCVVQDAGSPVGLITIEDILEQVVGRIEDEYPRDSKPSLRDAVLAGGVVLELAAQTPEQAITELAAAIPADRLPPGARIADLALARELDVSTDLGVGVAIPHARCPNLRSPLVVIGRSPDEIVFSPHPAEPVRLIFLLVMPAEKPDMQVFLLGQLARVAGNASLRERLLKASSPSEVIEVITEADRPLPDSSSSLVADSGVSH